MLAAFHREKGSTMCKSLNKVRVKIVVDNQAGDGLEAEHGFSLWIETGGRRILFDTGQGFAFPVNSARLGVPLERTDAVVLSHGHYDHGGGLDYASERAPDAVVHYHAAATKKRYSVRGGEAKPIHLSHQVVSLLESLPDHRRRLVEAPAEVVRGVGITGSIPRSVPGEDTGGPFYEDPEGLKPDPIEDDMALWIPTARGLVVFLGCGHSGLLNTLNYIRRISQEPRVHAILGGFHLQAASSKRLDRTVSALEQLGPDRIVPCHCTGERASRAFEEALGDRVIRGQAGMEMTFG